MRTLEQLLILLNIDDAARVSIAHTMGASSDPRSETLARRARRRPTYAARAANVQLLVEEDEAALLRVAGAREHVVASPAPPSTPYRRPRRESSRCASQSSA